MYGHISYGLHKGNSISRILRFSLESELRPGTVSKASLADKRRNRIKQLLCEASDQGAKLSYSDLSLILLVSRSTIKRDMKEIKKRLETQRP